MAATLLSSAKDKYGVKSMDVGDTRYVKVATAKMFHTALAMLRKRHPALRSRRFRTEPAFSGIIVERVE